MKATTIATIVTQLSRSRRITQASRAPKMGTVEPRKAALAGDVVFTA